MAAYAYPAQPTHAASSSIGGSSSLPVLPVSTNPLVPASNTTRVLMLSNFDPTLKTRDIQDVFDAWADDKGGFKIKWRDDVSCYIVFNDPTVAKRAYLSILGSPPPALSPASGPIPTLRPYTGTDVNEILNAVSARPRSRSVNNGHHARRSSAHNSGSSFAQFGINPGSGSTSSPTSTVAGAGGVQAQAPGPQGITTNGLAGTSHARKGSWGLGHRSRPSASGAAASAFMQGVAESPVEDERDAAAAGSTTTTGRSDSPADATVLAGSVPARVSTSA